MCVVLGLASQAGAQGPAPVEIQAAVMKKVFAYDDSLRHPVRVLVVHSGSSAEAAGDVAAAFEVLGVEAEPVDVDAAAEELEAASAAYFFSESASTDLRSLCVERRVLTMTGEVELTESGRVAFAVGLTDEGKPEIVIHLPRLEREGHVLPARLLALARVVR